MACLPAAAALVRSASHTSARDSVLDFFFVRRGHYAIVDLFRPDGIYGVWSRNGLIAYCVGFAAEIPFMVLLNLDLSGEKAAIASSERQLHELTQQARTWDGRSPVSSHFAENEDSAH